MSTLPAGVPATGAVPASAPTEADFDVKRRYVRVRGHKRGLIEFDFAIGDPDVVIELLMPPDDFHAFCRAQDAIVLDPEPEAAPEAVRDPTPEPTAATARDTGTRCALTHP